MKESSCPSATGATARALALLHLPVRVVAVASGEKTCQDLQFSYGVVPVHEPAMPSSRTEFVRQWVRRHELPGTFALLTHRTPFGDPAGDRRIEIMNL